MCFHEHWSNFEAYIALPQVGFGANFQVELDAEVKLLTRHVSGVNEQVLPSDRLARISVVIALFLSLSSQRVPTAPFEVLQALMFAVSYFSVLSPSPGSGVPKKGQGYVPCVSQVKLRCLALAAPCLAQHSLKHCKVWSVLLY